MARHWLRCAAQDYYETEVSLSAVQHVYALRPLTPAVVAELDQSVELADLEPDIAEIDYPR
ncbi:hypothetical protein [Nocardia goodfellowii]|uniref:Uncharacterized protein n=1 Tax=Nocardia goodfellowii TaxID=882446 RepID=A0ABS4QLD1_9NOCA|nr:hypothetical protein [Nocardia goodfellowii]MBP2191471.1 hypothetical protein [Nocardia goodfellowii]